MCSEFCVAEICWRLCFSYPFHHSSTIGRRQLFLRAGGYPPEYPVCEDVALWMTMQKLRARLDHGLNLM